MDKKTYRKYKRKITNTKALIDNKPPKFEVSAYYKPFSMKSEKNRILELDKENMKLLRQMNIITRLGASITNFVLITKLTSRYFFHFFLYTYTIIFRYLILM